MEDKSCYNCEYSGTYTVDKIPVCWLQTDDEVMYLEYIDWPCEDWEGKKDATKKYDESPVRFQS